MLQPPFDSILEALIKYMRSRLQQTLNQNAPIQARSMLCLRTLYTFTPWVCCKGLIRQSRKASDKEVHELAARKIPICTSTQGSTESVLRDHMNEERNLHSPLKIVRVFLAGLQRPWIKHGNLGLALREIKLKKKNKTGWEEVLRQRQPGLWKPEWG